MFLKENFADFLKYRFRVCKQIKNKSKKTLRYNHFLMFRFLIFACFYIPYKNRLFEYSNK